MKKLIVDKNHKKIDASRIGNPLKRITSGLLAGGMALSMYSGALTSSIKASADELDNNNSIMSIDEDNREINFGEKVTIQGSYKFKWTVGIAKTVDGFLTLSGLDEKSDLSDLKYFEKVKNLDLKCYSCNIFNSMPIMSNVETLSIECWDGSELTEEYIDMLRERFPNLKKLDIGNAIINPVFVEKMKGLEELSISPYRNCDIDFTKLTFLKKLTLGDEPYTVPVYFNTNEYNTLRNAGVEVELKDKETFLDISKKLDDIVNSLNISENSTDREKLDAVLIFVMDKLQYDPGVTAAIYSGNTDSVPVADFYKDGLLYAVFNKDTAVCGNYSALVEAIFDRIGSPQKSLIMAGSNHAWNLMNIDGELYYVDSTWLDDEKITNETVGETYVDDQGYEHKTIICHSVSSVDAIKEGNTDKLEWYMNSDFDSEPVSHTSDIMVPEYVLADVNNIEDKSGVILDNSSNKKVSINVNGKTISITLGALVGVMSAIGLAVHVNKNKKKRERERKQKLQSIFDYFDDDYDNGGFESSFDDDFDDNSFDFRK